MNGISLHFTTCSCIQSSLCAFQGWNHHGIRTEHNKTLNQFFTFGALQLQQSGLVAIDFLSRFQKDNYGIIEDDLATDENSIEGVPIPRSTVELSEEQFQQLQNLVNPLSESTDYGIDLYQEVIQYLDTIL